MLKTFSIGGVHPHENKLSAHQPIITAEVPAKAVILLGQHIGAPAKPVVAKGDMVKVGTKIAEPAGFVSAAIHSSVSGKVAKIDTVVDASGYAKPAIFIDVEGDEWEETIDRSKTLVKECEYSAEEIVKKIADAGIVGLGGACFPTRRSSDLIHTKINCRHINLSSRQKFLRRQLFCWASTLAHLPNQIGRAHV